MKKQIFSLMVCVMALFCSYPMFAEKYCNFTNDKLVTNGAHINLTWTTTQEGDVVISIAPGENATSASFRANGMGSIADFKVISGANQEDALTYFVIEYGGNGNTTYTLRRTGTKILPADAVIKYNKDYNFEWKVNDKDGWTTNPFEYTYGAVCGSTLATPVISSVASDGTITFGDVDGADLYMANIYWGMYFVKSVAVQSGEKIAFIPYLSGDYSVRLQAFNSSTEDFSDYSNPIVWSLTGDVENGELPKSIYCAKTYTTDNNPAYAANFTWETDINTGVLTISLTSALDGVSDEEVYFMETAMSSDAFKYNGGTMTDYFTKGWTDGVNNHSISWIPRTDEGHIPQFGAIISFNNAKVVYHPSNAGHKWPNLTFTDYVYGTACTQQKRNINVPTDMSVADDGTVTFTPTPAADSYKVYVYQSENLLHEQDIVSGNKINYVMCFAADYDVRLQAFNTTTEQESALSDAVTWHWQGNADAEVPMSAYCKYPFDIPNRTEYLANITWETDWVTGILSITISAPEGKDEATTYWRELGMNPDGFKYDGKKMQDYFICPERIKDGVTTQKTLTYIPINRSAVMYGKKITFGEQNVVWTVDGKDTYGAVSFPDYVYGTACTALARPHISNIATGGVISFDPVTGADSYVVSVYYDNEQIYSQTITQSGDVVDFKPYMPKSHTYQVYLHAQNTDGEYSAVSPVYNWELTGDEQNLPKSRVCNAQLIVDAYADSEAALTMETDKTTGNITITISGVYNPDTYFRGTGMKDDGFKYNGESFTTYFTRISAADMTNKETQIVYAPIDRSELEYGTKITYNGYGESKDIEWSIGGAAKYTPKMSYTYLYGTDCSIKDDEKPVMVSASLVSATSSSATIAVEATDNNQVVACNVSGDVTVDNVELANGRILLKGLQASKTYSVNIKAVDQAGNISDNSIVVEFTTAEGPKPSGHFFGTAQMQNIPIYQSQDNKPKDNNVMSSIDYYIVTVGDLLLGKATIHDGNTFWPDADAINFRTWNEQKSAFETNLAKAGNDSQNPTKKWMQIGAGDQHGLSEYGDMVPMTVFVKSWITPAGGGERVATHTTDFFDYHRGYINNPTTDATAPALDLSKVEVTDDEQSGKITFTISADAVTADDEYFFYVVDEAHELFAISLENTISIARPNETNGQTYTFRCYAVDFNGNMSECKEFAVTMPFDENTNLALNKANVSCGYVQEPNVASRANDGDATTFWTCFGTQELANAWWSVDLEDIYELNKLVVTWNDFSDDYTIYGSLDGSKWYAICNGAATAQGQTINHEITNAAARYLKVVSNKEKNVGIKEFEAYASSLAADDHQNPEVTVSEVSKEYGSATLQIIATDKDDAEVSHPIRTIIISDVDNQLTPAEYTLDANNQVTLSDLHFNTTYNFKVEVIDRVGNTTTKTLQVVLPFNPEVNLALNQPAFADAVQDDHTADKGNDGDDATFWSGFTNPDLTKDWWYVDLGVAYNVNKVIIKWMNDYAKHFVIQGAMTQAQVNNSQWTDVYEYIYEEVVSGTTQEHEFTEGAAMRYLRIQSKENSHVNGYEFFELQVYGTGFAADDTEAPEITLTDVLSTTHTTATLHLTAEDNVDGDLYDFYISEISKGLEETKYTADENGQVVLTGLNSVLGEYNLTIRVRDAIGHWTSTSLPVQLGYNELWKNMALNKTATAGSEQEGYESSKANDESMSTRWGNFGKVTENDSWWQVDMLYSCNIASVVILWQHYPEAGGIKIEASNDDQIWDQLFVSEQSYSENDMQEIILTESTTNQYRYVRISAPGNQYMSIYDFRVYASGMSVVIDENLDNSAIIGAADGLGNNIVTLTRTFIRDGYNYTLCLPFDLSENQMQEAFGADYKLWKLDDAYMKSAEVLYLDFKEVRNLEAGVPYIFCPKEGDDDIVNPVIEGVTINAAAPQVIGNNSLATMTGIYSPYTLPVENNYVLGSDNWLYQSDDTQMYGLRCYFTFGSGVSQNVRARAVFHNTDVVTDLETVDGSQCTMHDGKYVINGQFVIIRNGKTYNAVGESINR